MSETRRPLQELALTKKEDQLLHAIVTMILPARDLTTPANTLFRQPWMCETLEEDKWKRRSITNGHTVQQCSMVQCSTNQNRRAQTNLQSRPIPSPGGHTQEDQEASWQATARDFVIPSSESSALFCHNRSQSHLVSAT